jgi:hypothetical protein
MFKEEEEEEVNYISSAQVCVFQKVSSSDDLKWIRLIAIME